MQDGPEDNQCENYNAQQVSLSCQHAPLIKHISCLQKPDPCDILKQLHQNKLVIIDS